MRIGQDFLAFMLTGALALFAILSIAMFAVVSLR